MFTSCHRCIQRYILGEIQDPHCMKCKKVWTREFLDEKMSKSFINNELKIHRENILFEKEKNLLPDTQENVKMLTRQEEIDQEVKTIESTIEQLQKRVEELDQKKRDIQPYQLIRKHTQMNRIPCPVTHCRGFQEEKKRSKAEPEPDEKNKYILECGICAHQSCTMCRETYRDNHECQFENIKSISMLEKDTKRCPSCFVQIFKINGCDQMWCTNCHIAFDWKTGDKVRGVIHNPHYHSYLKEHGVNVPPAERSYQRFEFVNTDVIVHALTQQGCNELLLYQLIEVYRYMITYYELDLQRFPSRFDDIVNLDLRIMYLRHQMTEEEFKVKLQRRQKDTEKKIEYRDIGETYVDVIHELFLSFLETKNIDLLVQEIRAITATTQEAIFNLNKRYHSNLPLVRTLL